jgi:hypothetical protein
MVAVDMKRSRAQALKLDYARILKVALATLAIQTLVSTILLPSSSDLDKDIRGNLKEAGRKRSMAHAVRDARERSRPENRSNLYPVLPEQNYTRIDGNPPKQEWREVLFPDITLVGNVFAGADLLYKLLMSHPDTTVFTHKNKRDGCFNDTLDLQHLPEIQFPRQLQKFFKSFDYDPELDLNTMLTISKCFNVDDVIIRSRYLKTTKRKLFLYLYRDPADWLWNVWNSMPQTQLDKAGSADENYRTPELFHEILQSGELSKYAMQLLELRASTIRQAKKLINEFGRESVVFLRTEDMQPNSIETSPFLDQLASATHLSRSGFDLDMAKREHLCDNVKKEQGNCSNTYAISGYQPMLPETRALIYLYFNAECQIYQEEFQVVYQDCLHSLGEQSAKLGSLAMW